MVMHDKIHHRFFIADEKGESFLEYGLADKVCTVYHTFVPIALEGQGIAAKLASAFYHWAKEEGCLIQSECSYMTLWLLRHGKS